MAIFRSVGSLPQIDNSSQNFLSNVKQNLTYQTFIVKQCKICVTKFLDFLMDTRHLPAELSGLSVVSEISEEFGGVTEL